MTESALYDIWLTLALGYTSPKPKAIHALYHSLKEFYNGGESEWRLSGVLTQKDVAALLTTPLSKAQDVIDRCESLGISVIALGDADYPEKLSEIYDPPAVLYVKGTLPDFSTRLTIAMVGTRKATVYGKMASHLIAGSLAKVGAIIVSGGAVGIDSLSHIGAMEAGGTTVCVLGCGINYPYLQENKKMRDEIAATGALISAYPPDYPSGKYTFPERNRIISGLSDGVVVIEAGVKSGSLITARLAMEQGRDVFAVMGNITSPYSQGTNALIKDGAVPVTDYTDITSYYPQFSIVADPDDPVIPIPVHKKNIGVSEHAKKVYEAITADPIHIDMITAASGLPVNRVLQAITELELEGLIASERGRMYRLI